MYVHIACSERTADNAWLEVTQEYHTGPKRHRGSISGKHQMKKFSVVSCEGPYEP